MPHIEDDFTWLKASRSYNPSWIPIQVVAQTKRNELPQLVKYEEILAQDIAYKGPNHNAVLGTVALSCMSLVLSVGLYIMRQ
jgi:hypothetical protein